jgi:hypothetical protein
MPGGPYRIVQFDHPVGTGVSGSWCLWLSAIAKYNEPSTVPYCLPNELIGGEIGRFLGLPVPPGAIVHAPGTPRAEYCFASLDFNLTGNALPPVDVNDCVAQLLFSMTRVLNLQDYDRVRDEFQSVPQLNVGNK